MIEKIKKIFFKKEFFLFVFIGGLNTLNTIIISFIFSLLLNENLSFVIGYILSLFVAYVLNSYIIFKKKLSLEKLFKFCLAYIPNFIIQNIVVFIFFNGLGWHKLIVYCLAAALGIPVTFILQQFFTFKK